MTSGTVRAAIASLALSGCTVGSGESGFEGVNTSGLPGGTSGMSTTGAADSDSDDGADETGPKLDVEGIPDTCDSVLPVTLRDFRGAGEAGGHGDFEVSARGVIHEGEVYMGWNDVGCGLVQPALGADRKPAFYAGPPDVAEGGPMVRNGVGRQQRVVSGSGCWPSTSGVCNVGSCQPWTFDPPTYEIESTSTFDQWFNTVDGVNMEFELELDFEEDTPGSGIYVYDSTAFFPLDGMGFGDSPGQSHNFHFTTEVHVLFEYEAGQAFTFRGDDDLWIFVNGVLALDVGGLHEALEGTVDFDAQAGQLGITPGEVYEMDIFHAERQTGESNFRIETNIRCFVPNPVG